MKKALARMRAALWSWRARVLAAFAHWSVEPEHGGEAALQEEWARVRLTAELAADRLSRGEIACVSNPWKRGLREYVLWETSYHARLLHNEFEDTWAYLPQETRMTGWQGARTAVAA